MSQAEKKKLIQYESIDQLPASLNERTLTDRVCIVLGLGSTLLMIIIAIVCYDHDKFLKSNFPSDSDGSNCGIDLPDHQYLYFANLPQINRRVCVAECPTKSDTSLKCSPTDDTGCKIAKENQFSATFYENQPRHTRGGFFCWPVNQQLQQQIYKRSNLQERDSFYNSIDTIWYSAFVALTLSVVYLLLVQFIPVFMNYISVVLGMLFVLIGIVCVFTYETQFTTTKIIIGLVLLILLIFSLLTIYKHYDSLHLHSIYLKWSSKMLNDRKLSAIYILIFAVILVLFVLMLIGEFTGFWTAGELEFNPQNMIYYELTGTFPEIMTALLFFQLILGSTFIKEAFNFCISGNAVHWFMEEKISESQENHQRIKKSVWYPAKLMILRHLGSVFAGAFMIGLYGILDAIFDFLRPNEMNEHQMYNKIFEKYCKCWGNLFDFVRSDAMAYINLAGNPYCNSSRYCEFLCRKSITVQYAQSSSRIYRISAHFLIMGIVGIVGLYMNGKISIYAEILILLEALFISTMFISLHADAAEAIQIVLLTIQELYYLKRRGKQSDGYRLEDLSQLVREGMRTDLIHEIAEQRKKRNQIRRQKQAKKIKK